MKDMALQVPTKDRTYGSQVHGRGTARLDQPAATEKQVAFVRRLLDEKDIASTNITVTETFLDAVFSTKKATSNFIDLLMGCPRKPKAQQAPDAEPVTEGMYRKDGQIYKVQRAVHGSGNLYAKRLVALDEPVVMKTKTKTHEFEYAPGMVRRLTAEDKMSLEEAKEWGALYGSCCVCGATLTDERSIANGIGPVCGSKF
jgi:hypothetical protein